MSPYFSVIRLAAASSLRAVTGEGGDLLTRYVV